jgi:DNA helicase-4
VTVLVIYIITLQYKKQKEKDRIAKEEAERKLLEEEKKKNELHAFFKTNLQIISAAILDFNELINHANGYFTNYKLQSWKSKYSTIYSSIKPKDYKSIGLDVSMINSIEKFINIFENIESKRNVNNQFYVKAELEASTTLFDNIENRKLDIQQRTAIIQDEDNNLIIAGAGSGKTTTIVGKVNYILDKGFAKPEEILLISFTNDSASTLAKRIKNNSIEAKTFHKFGIDVISNVDSKKPSIFDVNQFDSIIKQFFNELILDSDYLKKVTTFFIEYLKPVIDESQFKNQGEHIQFLKDNNYRSFQLSSDKKTYKMEIVKSIQECQIANFLFFNGIEYKYEYPYEKDTATTLFQRWKPDFTLIQNDRTVYLEHFGIQRNGDIPKFFVKQNQTYEQARAIYNNKIKWARETNEKYETTLIESYSYEMSEGILFDNLTTNLKKHGIILRPKTPQEIWKIINEATKSDVNQISKLFLTFINLLKSNNYTFPDILYKNTSVADKFTRERNILLIDIIKPIYLKYESYLKDRKEIDFSDMINKAAIYIKNSNYNKKFKYIIIDEFQDISISRYQLIKALKDSNPECKTFCVGDDWQSIYRFSGSDITLFKDFEKYFGYTVKSKIETTYRFKKPLIDISSSFIQKNPFQEQKLLKSIATSKKTNYKIVYSSSDEQDDTIALKHVFDEIFKNGYNEENIFILSRYNHDLKRIKNYPPIFKIDYSNNKVSYEFKDQTRTIKMNATFMTVHKAKGLEAEIIILLNCNSGRLGFPSQISDDLILNLLLNEADQFENGEERRLFYVAMTRAKENLYLIADDKYKSKFILELENDSNDIVIKKCPNCITADLILRSGVNNNGHWSFHGCSNFAFGCDYQKWN